MNNKLKEAIEVLKKFKEWANTPTHGSSKYDLIKLFGAIDTVVNELEKPTYTAEDMEAFAEWTAIIQWIYDPTDKCWFQKHSTETKTTTKLRELWEQERREK